MTKEEERAIVFKRRAVKLKYLESPLRSRRRVLEGSPAGMAAARRDFHRSF